MGTKSFSGVYKEGQTEGIFGGQKEGILGGPIKRAREGTKRAKPETVIYPFFQVQDRSMIYSPIQGR